MTNMILKLTWYTRLIWDISDISGCITILISAALLLLPLVVGVFYVIIHTEIARLYGDWDGFVKFLEEKEKGNETLD